MQGGSQHLSADRRQSLKAALSVISLGRNSFYRLADAWIAHQTAPDLMFGGILSQLQRRDYLCEQGKDLRPTVAGDSFFRDLGIDVTGLSVKRRRFAFPSLDWSHRVPRPGALGAAKVIVRRKGSHAVRVRR